MPDFYDLLGVRSDASADDIKRAYRRAAREHHPDANHTDPQAEERFKEINVAYETLSDPEKRRRYDMFGPDSVGGAGGGSAGFGDVGFSDIFDAFFGGGVAGNPFGGRGRSGPMAGNDVGVDLHVEFTEAIFGVERDVEIHVRVPCDRCEASGAEPGTHPEPCGTCRGRGEVQQVRRTVLGQMVTSHTCPECRGAGMRIAHPCTDCRGEGRVAQLENLTLQVPAGIDSGAQLRLGDRGDAGVRGGPRGDLYVRIGVASPPTGWSREGSDLRYSLPVPITTAALGGRMSFDAVDGEPVHCEIMPGTPTGSTLRVRNRGVPRLRGSGRGDLFVDLDVVTPGDLDEEQEQLLRRLAELRGENVDTPGVVSRLRNVFR